MKSATEGSLFKGIRSIDFFRRAQRYRLATSATDNQNDVQAFSELAIMFDEMAYAFQRHEAKHGRSPPQVEGAVDARWFIRRRKGAAG
jgi:hypothetical protein